MTHTALHALKTSFTSTRTPPDHEAFQFVEVDSDGGLMTSDGVAISAGHVTGRTAVNKFGFNPTLTTATDPETIWDAGGLWVGPTVSRVHQLASTSTDDDGDPAGTGARTVTIFGLDANWAAQTETYTLNGTTDVPTTAYRRIFRMFVATAGSTGSNVGTITATADTDATVTAQINATNGQTGMAVYTVATGKTLYITQMNARIVGVGNAFAEMRLVANFGLDTATPSLRTQHFWSASADAASVMFDPPKAIAGPTDVEIRAQTVGGNVAISAWFDGVLI